GRGRVFRVCARSDSARDHREGQHNALQPNSRRGAEDHRRAPSGTRTRAAEHTNARPRTATSAQNASAPGARGQAPHGRSRRSQGPLAPATPLKNIVSCFFLVAMLLARSTPACAQKDDEARTLYQQGLRLYNLGEYDRAIEKLKTSYRLSAAPLLLYNIAQAY